MVVEGLSAKTFHASQGLADFNTENNSRCRVYDTEAWGHHHNFIVESTLLVAGVAADFAVGVVDPCQDSEGEVHAGLRVATSGIECEAWAISSKVGDGRLAA